METMIDLIDVTKSYGKGLPAVNHANLHVDKGEFVFVVGSSGSGKSTLIKLLMKELDSTSGQMIVSGERLEKMKHRRVAKYRRKLGVVFQDFRLLKDRNVYGKRCICTACYRETNASDPQTCSGGSSGSGTCWKNTNPSRMSFLVVSSREWRLPGHL